ncbi:TPR domain protein [Synechococcus sp. JA-2-3B'a(2-13)]|uniref:O-linked N-acetylglucosamine transferase, SPINDLY family protein n=1 Tax=Synechococcus sp. (strain JA-2-3B'a(2-13)) TaxID=321332 RepID=UPI0000694E26|nr:tetratricopeptide repeat protein [Synechococcus sp. JA-2-3B'a(2-13)]ABD02231.1 TPR domain protein [Synechococcus sp. JA-2-3B'a(2-13)]
MSGPGKGFGLGRAGKDRGEHLQRLLAQAVRHHQAGQWPQAVSLCQQVLQAQPTHPEALHLLGVCRQQQGSLDDAIALIRQALAHQPWFPDAHFNLGIVLKQAGQLAEAKTHLQLALEQGGPDAEVLYQLGLVLRQQGDLEAALVPLGQALELQPDFADAAYTLAILLRDCGREEEAAELFYQLWQADPADLAAALGWCVSQLPLLYASADQVSVARERYRQALQQVKGRWEHLPRDPETLERAAAGIGSVQPFFLPYQGQNDRDLQQLYGSLVRDVMAARYPQPSVLWQRHPGRVRVGIVSGLFRDHSVWKILTRGWVEALDRAQVALYGFHTSVIQDEVTCSLPPRFEHFVAGSRSIEEWQAAIREAQLDVLLYPEVGIDPVCAQLAALRLAPVQAMAWGHPQTSGLPTIDVFLSSELMEPPDGAGHYTEQLLPLPGIGTYYIPLEVDPAPVDWQAWGVDPDRVLYLCAQSLFKYLPQYDEVFPRIAREVGKCQFLFLRGRLSQGIRERFWQRLRRAFQAYDLAAEEYVVLLPELSPAEYAAYNALGDIYLDSLGWSGGNTTLEALPHGLPIVTLPGSLMRGRHTYAILQQMGILDTIAHTLDEYVQIASQLGLDPEWREQMGQQVKRRQERVYRDPAPIRALEEWLRSLKT